MSGQLEEVKAVFKGARMFAGLEDSHLHALAEIGQLQRLLEGQMIYSEQKPAQGLYVMGMGQVKVFQISPEGKEYILHIVGNGATFAEASTLGDHQCPASAVTMAPTTLVYLPGHDLLRVLSTDNDLCILVLKGMATQLCHLTRTLENIVLRDSLGRVAGYLLSLIEEGDQAPVKVRLPVKKRDLAAYLALTPETLSRTFGRLTELEAIRHEDNGDIELISFETLKGLSQA